jgi:acyl dehydratase
MATAVEPDGLRVGGGAMTAERFPVEAGHVMAFARAVGDFNPVYLDPSSAAAVDAGGTLAPPTFVQSSAHFDETYPLRPRPGVPWFGSATPPAPDATKTGGAPRSGGTGLHAEQHFTYHRPLRAGEELSVTNVPGRTWEKQGRRGGLLTFHESVTEYRDDSGAPVVTARAVSVMTSQTVKD